MCLFLLSFDTFGLVDKFRTSLLFSQSRPRNKAVSSRNKAANSRNKAANSRDKAVSPRDKAVDG